MCLYVSHAFNCLRGNNLCDDNAKNRQKVSDVRSIVLVWCLVQLTQAAIDIGDVGCTGLAPLVEVDFVSAIEHRTGR